ncbi:unnamed protein product [Lasius platythorax]|uniref:Uncharacterized protein n=1 Tax=Lasius platythorax TaxID=488582 RepID=A0AAV2NGR1_9HYME
MDKTKMDVITPGGRPGIFLENPPSTEAGLKDSEGGQPLFANYAHGKSTVTRSFLDADGLYQKKELRI